MNRLVLLVLAVACSARSAPSSPPPAPQPGIPEQPAVEQTDKPAPDRREVALSKAVVELLEKRHLLGKKLDDTISKQAFATYMDRLDPAKLFLLASDREKLAAYTDKIDDELHSGNLELAHLGQQMFVARTATVEKIVATVLASPMNHDDEEYLELDAKKVTPPTSEEELRERWRQRLELEVMERVAAMENRLKPPAKGTGSGAAGSGANRAGSAAPMTDIPPTPEAREAKVRADLAKSYAARFTRLKTPGPLDAASELVNAVCATFDPHTDYLPPADKANFDIAMSGSLEGIGAALREKDDLIEVSELVPGGAAWRQGKLSAGDLILSVQQSDTKDPVDVMNMHLDDVVQLIRGPKGTVVKLHVRKPDGHEEQIEITRDVIAIEASYARGAIVQRKKGPAYGYIYLPSFYGGSNGPRKASADVRRLLDNMNEKKVAGVVLDIRGNGGGLLQDSVALAGELIDKGPIVQVRNHDGDVDTLDDPKVGVELSAPVVVLVDQFSASASEILAGAMQDYHRAVIVGTGPTHGKGTVQAVIDLDRDADKPVLGVMKLTIEQFFRVSGSSTQREGVTPDITLPNPNGYIKSGERELEHAIEWTKIAPAPHVDWKVSWDLPALVKKSTERVAKNILFTKITQTEAILAKHRDDTRIPLARSAWDAREKAAKDELEKVSPELDKAAAKLTVKVIEDPTAAAPVPAPNGRTDDRMQKWQDQVSRDPWIDESVAILGDM